ARGEENFRVFSKSDLQVLADVANQYGRLHWKRLVDLTHDEPAYKAADRFRPKDGRAPMPYETFFEGTTSDMLEVAEEEQEHRNLVAAIR
ncbi:MAG: type II toxin-antitoxin system antitoxin SocA domain-containing protein, partial [Thermoanaerobaculia bacterium]